MSDCLSAKIDEGDLSDQIATVHQNLVDGSYATVRIDVSDRPAFGALDLQSLIALQKSADSLGVAVQLDGVQDDFLSLLEQRSSQLSMCSTD